MMSDASIPVARAERRQVAALPWRQGAEGIEVMLVTSRETRRWVTPKGGRMTDRTDAEAAAQEAWEEAGVRGVAAGEPVGSFRYLKRLKRRASRWCVVDLYPLKVEAELDDWPEAAERERRWMSPAEAATVVDEPELKVMLRKFEGS